MPILVTYREPQLFYGFQFLLSLVQIVSVTLSYKRFHTMSRPFYLFGFFTFLRAFIKSHIHRLPFKQCNAIKKPDLC